MPDTDNKQRTVMDEIDRTAKTLLEVSRLVNSTLEHETLLNRILESAGKVLPFDSASILLREGDSLFVKASLGFDDPRSLLGIRMPIAEYALNREVMDTGLPLIVRDVSRDPRWVRNRTTPESAGTRGWMGVPLAAGGKSIGILSLDSRRPDTYQASHVFVAAAFAAQVSIALENSRLYTETQRRLRELSAVNRISVAVTEHLDIGELCMVVGDTVRDIFKLDIVYLALVDEYEEWISTPYFYMDGAYQDFPPFRLGTGLSSVVIREGKTLLIDHDAEKRQCELGAIRRADRMPKTWLGIPLMSGKRAIGVLSAQNFEQEYCFSEEEISLLSTVASIAASAIQNSRLFMETTRREREATALAEIGREISSSLDLNTVVERIVNLSHHLLSRDTTAVYLTEASGKTLTVMAATGKDAAYLKADTVTVGRGLIGTTAKTGKALVENDVSKAPGAVHVAGTAEEGEGEKLMAIPLVVDDEVLGVLAVWRAADEPVFRERDLGFAESMARQAAVALKNARLFRAGERARVEAEQANRLKSQFLANMSHELRTPLNSIINFAYLLKEGAEGDMNAGQADLLGRIEESGRHLLDLINDVLDLAKIEAGRMELFLEEVDLAELASGVAATAQGLLRGKPVSLRMDIEPGLPPLRADRTRLRQILFNLVSNAVKFTERGSIVVSARERDGAAEICVRDTGIGMSREDLPRAFSEFVQIDGGLSRRVGGTGLGLPISQRFIEMHGGRLTAESTIGTGSAFTFTIPLCPPTADSSPAERPAAGLLPDSGEDETRVLVIDDDLGSCRALASQLSEVWRVKRLSSPLLAVDTVKAERPDAIVLDVMMPQLDGWEILKAIKSDPDTAGIPVIMCSMLRERQLAMSLDAADYLVKPVTREELKRALEAAAPGGGTVLAIDDDENALDIIRRVLDGKRYVVEFAHDGAAGLGAAKASRPDVILLDLLMPGMDGFQVMEGLKSDSDLRDIPVIVVTSKDLDAAERARFRDGAARFLRKGSFTADELTMAVRKARGHSRPGGTP